MFPQRKGSACLSIGLVSLLNFQLMAGPGNALILYPVLALSHVDSDRAVGMMEISAGAGEKPKMVRLSAGASKSSGLATEVGKESSQLPRSTEELLKSVEIDPNSALETDPEVAEVSGESLPDEFAAVESSEVMVGQDAAAADAIPEPSSDVVLAEPAGYRDYQDTLVRSDRDSRVETYVSESGDRFPGTWAAPPGSTATGGHPGYLREEQELSYTGQDGVTYFPPPSPEGAYGSSSPYVDPVTNSYHPGGPYAYQYDGLAPLGDPTYYEDTSYEIDGSLPMLTRSFRPEDAHLKVGPFYFQALYVESGILYSDYHGPAQFAPGQEDGWLGYSSFRFRMAAQISPYLYLTANGEVIYLYGENELGFRSGFAGRPFAKITYEREFGRWDFRAYAEFGTGSFFEDFGEEAYERAGRYSFGFYGRNNDDRVFDPYLYSRVGVDASTLVTPEWRLTLSADHTDYWYVGDDRNEDHWSREHAGVRYGAEPGKVPFTPFVSYDAYTNDYFDSTYHRLYTGGSGRLSENVTVDGKFGYLWRTGDFTNRDNWLWNIGLRHRINQRTTHGVRFGQDYFMSEFSIDSTVSSFLHYYITHDISSRLRLHGFAQWSNDEFLSGPLVGGEYERELYGFRLGYDISDRMRASLGYLSEETRNTRTGDERERDLFEARLDARIGPRTTAYLLYQHDDTDFYYEDLYMAGIRRHF